MKQHYKVWVYDNCGVATVESKDYSIAVSEKENVIVLTLKDAEDIWDAGARGDRMKNVPDAKYTTFKSWMEYKGVKI